MAEPKDIHVDLLAIDMTVGKHWLDPTEKAKGDPKLEAIRKRNRDKWLAKQKAEADKAAKSKSYVARARDDDDEQTEIELWPEEDEERDDFLDRCTFELEKCIGDRAEEVCEEKWDKSKTLGKRGFVNRKFQTGNLAIESCGKTCECEGKK